MTDFRNIKFIDISRRETAELEKLTAEINDLRSRIAKNLPMSEADTAELERLEAIQKAIKDTIAKYADPLFVCARAELASQTTGFRPIYVEHDGKGRLQVSNTPPPPPPTPQTGGGQSQGQGNTPTPPPQTSQTSGGGYHGQGNTAPPQGGGSQGQSGASGSGGNSSGNNTSDTDREIARVALILGLLQLNKAPLPIICVQIEKDAQGNVVKDQQTKQPKVVGIGPDDDPQHVNPNLPKFKEALFQAVGRVAGNLELAWKALDFMAGSVGIGVNSGSSTSQDDMGVSTLEYAEVFTKLVNQGITQHDPNLKRRVEERFDTVQEVGEPALLHEVEISLPDLEATTEFDVQPEHCRLFGAFIFASAMEELRVFQVVDALVDMSQRGAIALIKGPAGTQLYNYWREAPNRMTESERQTFYAMTLGLPTGQPGVAVNTDFQDLWLRFVSSVSTLVRESRVDQLLRAAVPAALNQQQVKKAARDLAVNMSAHGYGMIFYAAADLQKQINEIKDLLSDQELCKAVGARDMWGVIDQIAQTELGGARNGSKYRMLATSGAIITSWMAQNIDRLRDLTLPIIDLNTVQNPPSRPRGQTAVSAPTDYDLVNACEMWLADSAMIEDRIEQMSQPRESPQAPSRPIQIPSVARDLLESAGLSTGMSVGMGVGAPRPDYTNGRGNGRAARYQNY
jgi:hypothetical protein